MEKYIQAAYEYYRQDNAGNPDALTYDAFKAQLTTCQSCAKTKYVLPLAALAAGYYIGKARK